MMEIFDSTVYILPSCICICASTGCGLKIHFIIIIIIIIIYMSAYNFRENSVSEKHSYGVVFMFNLIRIITFFNKLYVFFDTVYV